jgi:hypothetical protein
MVVVLWQLFTVTVSLANQPTFKSPSVSGFSQDQRLLMRLYEHMKEPTLDEQQESRLRFVFLG